MDASAPNRKSCEILIIKDAIISSHSPPSCKVAEMAMIDPFDFFNSGRTALIVLYVPSWKIARDVTRRRSRRKFKIVNQHRSWMSERPSFLSWTMKYCGGVRRTCRFERTKSIPMTVSNALGDAASIYKKYSY